MNSIEITIRCISAIAVVIGLIFITVADVERIVQRRKRCIRVTAIGGILSIAGLIGFTSTLLLQKIERSKTCAHYTWEG